MEKTFKYNPPPFDKNADKLFQDWLNEQPGGYSIAIQTEAGVYIATANDGFFIPRGSEVSIAEDGTVTAVVTYPPSVRTVEEIIERRKQRRGWDE